MATKKWTVHDWGRLEYLDGGMMQCVVSEGKYPDGKVIAYCDPEDAHILAAAKDFYRAAKLRRKYEALPEDRGGENGPKGKARAAWLMAEEAAFIKASGGKK